MEDHLLEITTFDGQGYKPLVDFNCWRVAFLRYLDELDPARISFVEKHCETDEVFVLLNGQAVLYVGAGESELTSLSSQVMQPGTLYNVKKDAWHSVVLGRDATILLVENRDTASVNSAYFTLTPEHRQFVLEMARQAIPEWRSG